MIVVSNTSPLTNLAAIGQIEILQQLYGQIAIPEGVWVELNAYGKRWPGSREVEAADWIKRHKVQNLPLVITLQRDLDRGEADSIALAMELKADLVLLDEKEGRHIAQRLGLNVMGLVGVLIAARSKRIINELKPHLDALHQVAGFYLSESLYHEILKRVGEEK